MNHSSEKPTSVMRNRKVSRKVSARIAADVRRRLLQRYACLDSSNDQSRHEETSSSTAPANDSATRLKAFERRRVRITTSRMAALSRKRIHEKTMGTSSVSTPPLVATPSKANNITPLADRPCSRTPVRHPFGSRTNSATSAIPASPGSLSSAQSGSSSSSSSAIDHSLNEFEASLRQLIEQSFRDDVDAVAEVCGEESGDGFDDSERSTASLVEEVIDIVGDLVVDDSENVFDEKEDEQEEMDADDAFRYEVDEDVNMTDVCQPKETISDPIKYSKLDNSSCHNPLLYNHETTGTTPSPTLSPIPHASSSPSPPPTHIDLDSTLDISLMARENMCAALDTTPVYHKSRPQTATLDSVETPTSCIIDDIISANMPTKRRHSTAKPGHGTVKRVCSPDLDDNG